MRGPSLSGGHGYDVVRRYTVVVRDVEQLLVWEMLCAD